MHLLKSYECFVNFLNFTTTILPVTTLKSIDEVVYEKGLDLFLGLMSYYSAGNLINAYFLNSGKCILFVPVIQVVDLEASLKILYSFLIACGLILFFLASAYFFKLQINEWSVFNIYSLMLGIRVDMDPRRCLRTKIIFFTLFAVSFFFVSDLMSDMTSVKYVDIEIPVVQSFEDVLEKNITVLVGSELILSFLRNHTSGIVRRIADKAGINPNNNAAFNKIYIKSYDDAEKMMQKIFIF